MNNSQTLKPDWKIWRFDQMATSVADRIDNPAEADVEHYVGLEHLDTDSLKIRRWGVPTDVEATKLRFRKGDIIFGRRRVYQRKVGIAEFDGICSAHALVLRPKIDVILPEFLPFFMQRDLFMNRALEISVGSLSPTINWRTLASQEFALPPMEEQRRIAQLLQEYESTIESYRIAEEAAKTLRQSMIENRIAISDKYVLFDSLLLDTAYGCSSKSSNEPVGTPILRIPNVFRDELYLSDLQWLVANDVDLARYSVKAGDILIVRTNGNPEYVGRCVVIPSLETAMVYASYLIRLRLRLDLALPEFIAGVLNSSSLRRKLRGDVRSSAGNYNLNTEGIRRQKIPLPSLHDQQDFVDRLSMLNSAIKSLQCRSENAVGLKKTILTQMEM